MWLRAILSFALVGLITTQTRAAVAGAALRDANPGESGWSATKIERLDPAKVAEQWAKLWSARQLDQLIELYAPDAVFLTGQGARISGREAIRALLKSALDTINPKLTVHSIVTEQSGNLAYDSGQYLETITPLAGGASHDGKGNYVIVFKRQEDGKWLIIQHVWTDAPAVGR
jgi:uncharacterized protein (TIGR02246 family)